MPTIWMNGKAAVTKEELVTEYWTPKEIKDAKDGEYYDLFWNKLKSLQSQLTRYKDKPYGIKRLVNGGNGRCMLVDLDSLSPELQSVLGDPRKVDHVLENFYTTDMNAAAYYATFLRLDRSMKPEEQEKYITNASVLNAAVTLMHERTTMRKNMSFSVTEVKKTILSDVTSFNDTLRAKYNVEHSLPANFRRFYETYNAYTRAMHPEPKHAYYTLINDPEGNRADNARAITHREEKLLNLIFAGQDKKPTKVETARAYSSFLEGYTEVYEKTTGELIDRKAYNELSDSAISAYLRGWKVSIGTQKRRTGNRQEFIGKYVPHAQKGRPEYAGSLYSIDDRQPPFWYEHGKRAWFYVGLDVASGCFTTVVWGKDKKGLIVDFYRQIIRNYAEWGFSLPYELECESSLNSSYKDTLLKDGNMFGKVRIERNNARGKRIERAFGELRYDVEKKHIGWIARPFAKSDNNAMGTHDVPIIPYEELIPARLRDVETVNNMPHPTHPEMTRWEYFCKKQNPELGAIPYQRILPHIGYANKVYCRAGYMMLQGEKRAIAEQGEILTGEQQIAKMTQIEGKQTTIYWLDDNQGGVLKALVYCDGRYVCEAMEMPKFSAAVIERKGDAVQEAAYVLQNKYITTVTTFANRQARAIGDSKRELGIVEPEVEKQEGGFQFGLSNFRPSKDFSDVDDRIVDTNVEDGEDDVLHQDDGDYMDRMREASQDGI